ncbi:MAG: hypothetical protein ACLFPA_10915 [Dichotomicrobium sp.]
MSTDEGHHENFADERTRWLSRLIPLWPAEIESDDIAAAERVVRALARALRGERCRGRAGHWSYDINRHLALARALREERSRLMRLRGNGQASPVRETGASPPRAS